MKFHSRRPLIWKWFLWILLHLEDVRFTSRELDAHIKGSYYKILSYRPSWPKLAILKRMGILKEVGMDKNGPIVYQVQDPKELRKLYNYVCSLCAKKSQ